MEKNPMLIKSQKIQLTLCWCGSGLAVWVSVSVRVRVRVRVRAPRKGKGSNIPKTWQDTTHPLVVSRTFTAKVLGLALGLKC